MITRKQYIKDIYSHYWLTARQDKYGVFPPYDRHLADLVLSSLKPDTVLEVAVGTGIPFADHFQKTGSVVYGIDIAPVLIENAKTIIRTFGLKSEMRKH